MRRIPREGELYVPDRSITRDITCLKAGLSMLGTTTRQRADVYDDPNEITLQSAKEYGPNYYRSNGMQPWDVIEAFELDYFLGTVIKYVLRAGRKGSKLEDLHKAQHFLQRAVELEEGK